MAVSLQLQDILNEALFLMRESDACNFGGVPLFNGQFPAAMMIPRVNSAIAEFMEEAGIPRSLTEKIAAVPVTQVTDFALPGDAAGLIQVEYQQGTPVVTQGFSAVTAGVGVVVRPLSMNGIVVGGTALIDTNTSGVQETIVFSAVTTTTFTATFQYSHGANFLIQLSGVNTTIAAGVTAGLRTVTPVSMAGIIAGSALLVDTVASGFQETVTVLSTTPTTWTGTFQYTHAINVIIAGAGGYLVPYALERLTLLEWRAVTGNAYLRTSPQGLPYAFREPIANAIRFFPVIQATSVTTPDNIIFTYSTYGTTLVNYTDSPNIPIGLQRAVIYKTAEDYVRVKLGNTMGDWCHGRYQQFVKMAKSHRFNADQTGDYGFTDAEDSTPLAEDGLYS